ncbi:MAG TPA: hypothetical protein EYP67_06670 [Methanosarcinales archaeon]|nr:hypothetical protein [Methanosarcinales archaeon]
MRKEILILVIITLLMSLSHAQSIKSISELKEEIYNNKKTMNEDICGYTYLQNTLSDGEELIRNHELSKLPVNDLAHFLNHVLDFADTAGKADTTFEEGKFDDSMDELDRLKSLKSIAESKKTVLVRQGYNEYYVDDALKNMERTIKMCGDRNCLDLIKKADDSGKLDDKVFFLDYAIQICCEYKSEECEDLNIKSEDIKNEIERKKREAENYEVGGDLNLTAARDAKIKLFSLDYYDKSIKYYDEGYEIYENILGMRASDAARLKEKRDDVKLERSDVFQEVLKNYSIYSLISLVAVVLGLRITKNYRREIRLNRMVKRVL